MILDNKTILFQGDSITDMARGRSTWDKNHLYGHSFVFLLASKFGYETPEKNIIIYNRGVSGDRCTDVYNRWDYDALSLKPDIVSLLVGINDIILDADKNDGVCAEKYTEVLSNIIEKTKDTLPNTQFIICEPFTHIESLKDEYKDLFSKRVPEHRKAAKTVAEKYNCLFVPLQGDFDAAYIKHPELPENYWIWDGIHPTAAGQQLIARKWLKCTQ